MRRVRRKGSRSAALSTYVSTASPASELLAHRQSDQPGIERDRLDFRATLRGHIRFKVKLLDIEIDEIILVQRIAEPRLQDGTGICLEILQVLSLLWLRIPPDLQTRSIRALIDQGCKP